MENVAPLERGAGVWPNAGPALAILSSGALACKTRPALLAARIPTARTGTLPGGGVTANGTRALLPGATTWW